MAKITKTSVLDGTLDEMSIASSVCGNYQDYIGLSAQEFQIRGKLMLQVCHRLDALNLGQSEAAQRLGIGQPDVSKLMNMRVKRFSAIRLMEFLNMLNVDVDITIRPRPTNSTARGVVRVIGNVRTTRS